MSTAASTPRFRILLIASLTVLALIAAACSKSGASSDDIPDLSEVSGSVPADAKAAPDFTVMTMDGGGFTLSEHLDTDGRPVFLNMWASWCPPCRSEMPDINSASQAHENVKFIGIAVNDVPADSIKFATSIDIRYTIGFDENGEVAHAYGIPGLPASYLISPDGVILDMVFGAVTEEQIDDMLGRWFS